ncbi:MAG TPA: hypothetical protein VE826_03335 [Dongiaceae bacterium]|nr:hypothetical protein [Dongiaceae bacterium]
MSAAASAPVVCARAAGTSVCAEMRAVLASTHDELVAAYAAQHGPAGRAALTELLAGSAAAFFLSGVDLMVIEDGTRRRFVVIEVNSAPGFAYCTPGADAWELAYERTIDLLLGHAPPAAHGGLALLTESKVPVETEGFRRCLERRLGRAIAVLGPAELRAAERFVTERGTVLAHGGREISGGLRYLHHLPWELLPPSAAGTFVNGTGVDLCGGRDKVAAQLAFERFTAAFGPRGLRVNAPPGSVVRSAEELEAVLARLGEHVVRKARHGNSGIGVDFLRGDEEDARRPPPPYPYLVQEMLLPRGAAVNGAHLAAATAGGRPYAYDLRVVVGGFPGGYRPLMIYARRARRSLDELGRFDAADLAALDDFMKVNIAVPQPGGGFAMEEERLVLPDADGFAALGLGVDDYRVAVAESILATAAVDRFGTPYAPA